MTRGQVFRIKSSNRQKRAGRERGKGGAAQGSYSQEKDKPASALDASACADDKVGLLLKWTRTLCSLTLFQASSGS